MAAGGKLLLIAKCEYHEELETLIPRLLDENNHNAEVVADKFHVWGTAVRTWLQVNHYKFNRKTRRWEKQSETETAA
jgi:hypothetical protein